MRTQEIAKEIRNTMKELKGVKLSITSDYNHINVKLMAANFNAILIDKGNVQLNKYNFNSDERISKEAKTVFQLVEEIINKYHYDNSDSMIDYFDTNFYYYYQIGSWDKDFKILN